MTELPTDLLKELELAVKDCECELVHVGFGGDRLQVMIDRDEGINVDDCERVSKQISPILDVHDFGSGKYVLEVTSPGLDRPLFGDEDFERFAGHMARVQWMDEGKKRTDLGRLGDFSQGDREVALIEGDHTLRIPVDSVIAAQLEIEL